MRYLLILIAFCTASGLSTVSAACNAPKDLMVHFVTSNSAKVSWKHVNAAQSYTVQYAYAAIPTTWQDTTVTDTTFTLQPLAFGAVYVIQVRSNCSNGASAYSPSITFATQPKWEQTDLTFYNTDGNAKIGVGTGTPQATLDLRGNLVVQGTTGGVPVSGGGTRLEWVPALGAFRAGTVTAAQWDANNVGQYSVAMGYNPKAKGNYSLALGRGADALGDHSAAIGRQSKASGDDSYAIGYQAQATAAGAYAFGQNVSAAAANSFAFGYGPAGGVAVNNAPGTIAFYAGAAQPAFKLGVPIGGGCEGELGVEFLNGLTIRRPNEICDGYLSVEGSICATRDISADRYVKAGQAFVLGESCTLRNRPVYLKHVNDGERFDIWSQSSNNDNSYLTIVRSNGNVGIGTVNPQNKLDVTGTMRAYEVKVRVGWSDYVFAPEYRLRPLTEVEAYIAAHGHLPEVPSAAVIEHPDGGLQLGEMSALHMKKIEELTLYLIEMNKRIAALEAENARLKEAIPTR